MIDNVFGVGHKIFNFICEQVLEIVKIPVNTPRYEGSIERMEKYLGYYKRILIILAQICKIKQSKIWDKDGIEEEIIEDDENDHSWGFVDWILSNTFRLYNGTTKYNIKYLYTIIKEYN